MKEIFFILVSLFVLGCAMGVIVSRSPIYSAFNLILSFFGVAVIFLLLGSPFLAAIQVLIYTGAIVVLFVFVVMLLNLSHTSSPLSGQSALSIFFSTVAVWFFSLIVLKVMNSILLPMSQGLTSLAPVNPEGGAGEIQKISLALFGEYLWPFEILSLFLLVLIVGIYALARPHTVWPKKGS